MKKKEATKIVRAVVDEIDGDLARLIFEGTDRSAAVPSTLIAAAGEGDLVEVTFKVLKKESKAAREEVAKLITDLKER